LTTSARVYIFGPAMTGTRPDGSPSASSAIRSATSPASTGWNRESRAREGEWPTVAYAFLAVLARGETTGYQLARFMDKPVGLFWQAPHSQIYPQLAALERGGMVTSTAEPGPGPRARKTYTVTDAGRALLRDWVTTRPEQRAVRDEMVLRSYAAWIADRAEAAALFRAEQITHEQRLAELEQMAEN
jgi:DNA-binding PadR family transcriptional regulator